MTSQNTIPATAIPLWQRRVLEAIQTVSAEYTHLATTSDPRDRLASDLGYRHNQRLDLIRRADILGVPGAWIDLARTQGDSGHPWRSDTALPEDGGARERLLERLHGQLRTLDEMAVVDTERHHRRTEAAPPPELAAAGADDYLRTAVRHNMNLQWQLASTYADAISTTPAERDRARDAITADRSRTLDTAAVLDSYTLERKWETFASPWFGADLQRLHDTLEPDPDHPPAQPAPGFPTPYTVLGQVQAQRRHHPRPDPPPHATATAIDLAVPADLSRSWTAHQPPTTPAPDASSAPGPEP
ncbi:hypothetical protein [Nocardia wallacei]|uniref:hypothetical protein n=1 Tax=Nocardia wallacei TaxID=480035 RepID=UPI002453F4C2|nr:hypothetical protein [Nocardia wallacei]